MKIIFFIFIIITCLTGGELCAQRKDTSDYFAIGLYGGSYIGQRPLVEDNNYLNSIGAEGEYYKFRDLSFYVQGIYEFTHADKRIYPGPPPMNERQRFHGPETYRLIFSFGGRYYLRSKNVNPFFQLGISHETNFVGSYHYREDFPFEGWIEHNFNGYYSYRLSADLGVGISFKLSELFKLEFKYDLYKTLVNEDNNFTGFSVLGGIKYNL